jgi:AraC-like DNA-binding protein
VGIVDRGRTVSYLRGKNATVARGQIALIHPDEVHSCNPLRGSGWTYRLFYLDKKWLRELSRELSDDDGGYPDFEKAVVEDPSLFRDLSRLSVLVAEGAERMQKETSAIATFSRLLIRHGRIPERRVDDRAQRAVRLVQEYIDEHLAEHTSLKELSVIAGMSRYHLLRLFKQTAGLPPHAWRNQRRIHRARRLLSAGMPIADVALDSGFSDQSHFSRKFKPIVGTTPRRYRFHSS